MRRLSLGAVLSTQGNGRDERPEIVIGVEGTEGPAMSYTRFALGCPRHKKVAALSDAAFRLWVSGMDRSREQASDGVLDDADLDLVPRCPPKGKRRTELITELVSAGLWEALGKAWLIHDYLDWQDSAEQIKARRANARERMRTVRANRSRTDDEPPTNGGGTDDVRSLAVRSRSSDQIVRTISGSGSESGSEIGSGSGSDAPACVDAGETARELPMPLDWQPHPASIASLAAWAKAPESAILAEAEEFKSYWTMGRGQGTPKAFWQREFRERIRRRKNEGKLGNGHATAPANETAHERWSREQAERIATLEAAEAPR